MSVFVHEFCCSGAFAGELRDSSLTREGLAMLAAVVEDFSRSSAEPGRVVTTLDSRLRESPATASIRGHSQVTWVDSPAEERSRFDELAARSEAALVIAPESGGLLLERRQMTDLAGGRFLGHSREAIRLCTDKLRFHDHLAERSLPTIPTSAGDLSARRNEDRFPIVIKPRDGAGSVNTFLVRDRDDFETGRGQLRACFAEANSEPIVQPYLQGRPLSAAAWVDPNTQQIEVFPLVEQRLSRDGLFQFQGGRIPALEISTEIAAEAIQLVTAACLSLPGLFGYIGFDLILTADEPRVRIVEANPRLTTSYVGYRRLTRENLAARMLRSEAAWEPIVWDVDVTGSDPVAPLEFDADGEVRILASSER